MYGPLQKGVVVLTTPCRTVALIYRNVEDVPEI